MAQKRDYVLENALQGDLDAIENILGQCYAPLFDMGYHLYGDADTPQPALRVALETLAKQLIAGKLVGSTPFIVATRAFVESLQESLPKAIPETSPLLAGVETDAALAILATAALDLDGAERDEALNWHQGRAKSKALQALAEVDMTDEAFRDRLDEISAQVSLPEGLVDAVVDQFDEDEN